MATQSKKKPTVGMNKDVDHDVKYVRNQQGHSIIFWGFMCCGLIGIPFVIYYTKSPNHYWHA